MQVLHMPDAEGPKEFSYDEEWLAVLRSTHSLMSLQRRPVALPGEMPISFPDPLMQLPQLPMRPNYTFMCIVISVLKVG